MSFSVSLDDGGLEYGSTDLASVFAQRRNLFRPRFWSMLSDLQRFYKDAPRALIAGEDEGLTLGEFLDRRSYGPAFQNDSFCCPKRRYLVDQRRVDPRLPVYEFRAVLSEPWAA